MKAEFYNNRYCQCTIICDPFGLLKRTTFKKSFIFTAADVKVHVSVVNTSPYFIIVQIISSYADNIISVPFRSLGIFIIILKYLTFQNFGIFITANIQCGR